MFKSVLQEASEGIAGNQTMDVSEKDKDFFSSNGYLVVRNLLTPEFSGEILNEAMQIIRGERWHPNWGQGSGGGVKGRGHPLAAGNQEATAS
jgi:hypothetical protein